MQEILNTETPIKTIKVKPSKILKEVWMSPGLLKCIRKQKQLYKKTLKKTQVKWITSDTRITGIN